MKVQMVFKGFSLSILLSMLVASGGAMASNTVWDFLSEISVQRLDENFFANPANLALSETVHSLSEKRYEGPGPSFPDGAKIDKTVAIRFYNGSPAAALAVAYLSGRCIKRDEIESKYPDVKAMAPPTHGYPDAVWTHGTTIGNGKIEFLVNAHSSCLQVVKVYRDGPVE